MTRDEIAIDLAVTVLEHCEFDKKGRLVMAGNSKAKDYLQYMKDVRNSKERQDDTK